MLRAYHILTEAMTYIQDMSIPEEARTLRMIQYCTEEIQEVHREMAEAIQAMESMQEQLNQILKRR